MRGNHEGGLTTPDCSRSIPAYAGEPGAAAPGRVLQRVYPRVCGGTYCRLARLRVAAGLSPRMRGNQNAQNGILGAERSIPAYAGEPSSY